VHCSTLHTVRLEADGTPEVVPPRRHDDLAVDDWRWCVVVETPSGAVGSDTMIAAVTGLALSFSATQLQVLVEHFVGYELPSYTTSLVNHLVKNNNNAIIGRVA